MVIPKDFTFYAGEEFTGVLQAYPDLRLHLTNHFNSSFRSYKRTVANTSNYEQMLSATEYFCASVKQAYHFHVTSLDKQDLMAVLDRTVFSAYLSAEGSLCGCLSLVPETVKAIDYHHRLYADKLH